MKSKIKELDIMNYVTDILNKNIFGKTFKTGLYGNPIYKIVNDTEIDIREVIDEYTYLIKKEKYIPFSFSGLDGIYTPLPDITLGEFTIQCEILVNVDNQDSQSTLFAIENARDLFVGKRDVIKCHLFDYDNPKSKPVIKYLDIVTNSENITYGTQFIFNGLRYINVFLTVDMVISDGIAFGNDFEITIKSYTTGIENRINPVIFSFGTSQELEPFQLLNKYDTTVQDRAREVHNFVKSRGYSTTFALLYDRNNPIIVELFNEGRKKIDKPNIYKITTKEFEYDRNTGERKEIVENLNERDMIFGEVQTDDMSYGEIVTFGIGFGVSAKKGS